jgi:hypothetical protein
MSHPGPGNEDARLPPSEDSSCEQSFMRGFPQQTSNESYVVLSLPATRVVADSHAAMHSHFAAHVIYGLHPDLVEDSDALCCPAYPRTLRAITMRCTSLVPS